MRKFVLIGLVVAAAGGAAYYFGAFSKSGAATSTNGGGAGAPGRGGAPGGGAPGAAGGQRPQGQGGGFPGMGGGGPRAPMTVEMVAVKKGDVAAHLTVVGNLIGLQTVDVAPRTNGRLMSVSVQMGDPVRRGQLMAKIEDR